MTNGIDTIGPVTEKTVNYNQIEELEHGDSVQEYDAVAFTEEGVYGVPGTAAEEDIRTELDVDNVYKRNISYDEDSRVSASSPRVNEEMMGELASIAESPFAVLDGKVQAREGQSTDTVYQSPFANDPIDRID